MYVSCHRYFLPGTSLEPAVIPTAQALSFTLQYFPYYLWCSKYSCLLQWIYRMFSWYSVQIFFGFSSYYWYNCTFQFPHSLYLLLLLLLLLLFTAIELSPGGSGYFTCIQNMKLVTNKFKSGGLHGKHAVSSTCFGHHYVHLQER